MILRIEKSIKASVLPVRLRQLVILEQFGDLAESRIHILFVHRQVGAALHLLHELYQLARHLVQVKLSVG